MHPLQEECGYKAKKVIDLPQYAQNNELVEICLFDPEMALPFTSLPVRVNFPHNVKQIACGAFHTLVLTDQGLVFGTGLNSRGQLGIGKDDQLKQTFTACPITIASPIIQIACGDDFSLLLSQSGNVYSTGCGRLGIHGQGDHQEELGDRSTF